MKEPVLILSDLHLGHVASRIDDVKCLRPVIEGAGTVIFNGDTYQELAEVFRPRSEAMLSELKTLCEELGADPVFLSGNHDPGWPGKGWVELAEGRIVVTHGDAVMWACSPWNREVLANWDDLIQAWEEHRSSEDDAGERLRWARRVAVQFRARTHPGGRSFLRRVHDALKPPKRVLKILEVWWKHARASSDFAAKYFPQSEVMVTGHFHSGGCWRFDEHMVLNTGAYVAPHEARWVEWQDGWLRYGKVDRNTQYRRGEVLGVWRFSKV